MLEWFKKWMTRAVQVPLEEREPVTADEALVQLRQMTSDAEIDDVWTGLDENANEVRAEVEDDVDDGTLGEYPMHAAVIWLGYRDGNDEVALSERVRQRLEDACLWAFQFEENHILLGGALGALDGLSQEEREDFALQLFEKLGPESVRRFWLLLKVRSRRFLKSVSAALQSFEHHQRPRMAGAFRQFTDDEVELLLEFADLESPGAEMWVVALGACNSPRATERLEKALDHDDSDVVRAARRALAERSG